MWYFPNRSCCLSNCHNFFFFVFAETLGFQTNWNSIFVSIHTVEKFQITIVKQPLTVPPTCEWGGGSSLVLYTLFKCQISTGSNRSKHVLLQLDCTGAASIIRFQLSSAITQDKTWYTKTQFTRQLCKTENPWFNSNPTQNPHRGCTFQNKRALCIPLNFF